MWTVNHMVFEHLSLWADRIQAQSTAGSKKFPPVLNVKTEVLNEWCLEKSYTFQLHMSHDMRFPTMWYVRPAKAETSLILRTD